jgi:hypothetical protein
MLDVRPEETTVANEIEAQPAFVISQSTWRLLLRVSRQRTRLLRQIRSHRQPITSITEIASTGQVSPPAMVHQNRHRAIFFVPETLREYLTSRRWHPSQKFSPVARGRFTLDLQWTRTEEIVPWVPPFGGDARVLAPAPLADRVRKELLGAYEAYGTRARV